MKAPLVKGPIVVTGIDSSIQGLESVGRFHVPLTESERENPKRFCGVRYQLDWCLTWVWFNWLTGVKGDGFFTTVNLMLEKSLKLMNDALSAPVEARTLYHRGIHDLACFHLASMAGNRDLLIKLAEVSTYALDNKSFESSAEAWAGLWKFSLLGDRSKAEEQMAIMYSSTRPMNLRLPRRQVVEAWLSKDWKHFNRALQSAYKQRWATCQKYGDIINEDGNEVFVASDKMYSRTIVNWQENAFAIQAWTRGVDIPFDPLFLPAISVAGLTREGQPIAGRKPLI